MSGVAPSEIPGCVGYAGYPGTRSSGRSGRSLFDTSAYVGNSGYVLISKNTRGMPGITGTRQCSIYPGISGMSGIFPFEIPGYIGYGRFAYLQNTRGGQVCRVCAPSKHSGTPGTLGMPLEIHALGGHNHRGTLRTTYGKDYTV